jgi:hypothetical protein
LFLGKLSDLLAANGEVGIEEFSRSQLGKSSGGPKSLDMLLVIKELEKELLDLRIVHSEDKDIILDEGDYHQRKVSIVPIIARKDSW